MRFLNNFSLEKVQLTKGPTKEKVVLGSDFVSILSCAKLFFLWLTWVQILIDKKVHVLQTCRSSLANMTNVAFPLLVKWKCTER